VKQDGLILPAVGTALRMCYDRQTAIVAIALQIPSLRPSARRLSFG
jgi:hypothetical protein